MIRFEILEIRGHGSPVQSGHENAVEVLVGRAAFEALPGREVIRHDRPVLAVGQGGGRRAVSASTQAMAFCALHLFEYFKSPIEALWTRGGLWRYWDHRFGLLFVEPWRKWFYVSNEIYALLPRQREPGRHSAGMETPP